MAIIKVFHHIAIMSEKFTPEDTELTPFEDLLSFGDVTEADLWDAVNDWLENFTPAEFRGLINAEVNNAE